MTLWQENLQRLVALIEQRVAEAEKAIGPFDYNQIKGWHDKNRAAGQAIVDLLVYQENARFNDGGAAMSLTLAGMRASCTSGHFGLLRNWVKGARRRLAAIEGVPPCEPSPYRPLEKGPDERHRDVINLQGSGPAPIEPREGV